MYSLQIAKEIHSRYSLKTNNMLCFYGLHINHTKAEYIQLHTATGINLYLIFYSN